MYHLDKTSLALESVQNEHEVRAVRDNYNKNQKHKTLTVLNIIYNRMKTSVFQHAVSND